MLDWVIEGLLSWISKNITALLDAINQPILSLLGMDMSVMQDYFPYAVASVQAMKYFGIALLFVILVFQLVRAMGGPLTDGENPMILLARSVLFFFVIWNSDELFAYLIKLGGYPYNVFLNDVQVTAEDFTFAGFWSQCDTWVTNLGLAATGVGTIICIIMVIIIAWNWFKLLLESVERYVLLGVLCYTAPLPLATGGSQSTANVFKAWCRMVASQLLLLVLNVWFLRGFASCVGSGLGDGGAIAMGSSDGNFLLWTFCALAWLKIGQRVDTYLATLGMSAAQTGSSMAMEMLVASRALGGGASVGSSIAGRASSVFTRGGGAAGAAAAAAGGNSPVPGGGGASPFTNFLGKVSPANMQADANTINGMKTTPFSAAAWVGQQVAGAQTAASTQGLSGAAISRVANNPGDGRILGTPALNRGLANGNYIGALQGQQLSGSMVSSGHISTMATGADGKTTDLDFFNTSMYDKPEGGFSVVSASDGSQWYQMASGEGREEFFDTPSFDGSEAAEDFAAAFPAIAGDTSLRTVDAGIMEASFQGADDADNAMDAGGGGGGAMWYSSALFDEPMQDHSSITDANGTSWYQVANPAAVPSSVDAATQMLPDAGIAGAISCTGNQTNGMFEVRHEDGAGTRFYDSSCYAPPTGSPSRTYADTTGHKWYAVPGTPRDNGSVSYAASPRYIAQTPAKRSTAPEKAPRRRGESASGDASNKGKRR